MLLNGLYISIIGMLTVFLILFLIEYSTKMISAIVHFPDSLKQMNINKIKKHPYLKVILQLLFKINDSSDEKIILKSSDWLFSKRALTINRFSRIQNMNQIKRINHFRTTDYKQKKGI